ncbi:MAG: ester cyclase [Actinobacteria bacterium]|nr:MAG: ester cyclase [Actinomycetota bacterium]
MKKEEIEQLNDATLATWDAGDADAFAEFLADDVVWYDWTLPEPLHGKAAAKAYFAGLTTAFPDMRTKTVVAVIGDDAVATEVEWTGTNTGPLAMGGTELPPTGKTVTGRGSYIARVRDGKVVEFRAYQDAIGLMGQLGLLPQG